MDEGNAGAKEPAQNLKTWKHRPAHCSVLKGSARIDGSADLDFYQALEPTQTDLNDLISETSAASIEIHCSQRWRRERVLGGSRQLYRSLGKLDISWYTNMFPTTIRTYLPRQGQTHSNHR